MKPPRRLLVLFSVCLAASCCLVSADMVTLPGPPALSSGANTNADGQAWDDAVDGLQCRAWVDDAVVRPGSDIKVHYELKNVGDGNLALLRPWDPPHNVHIEWLDGSNPCSCKDQPRKRQYVGRDNFVTLGPGETFDGKVDARYLRSELEEETRRPVQFRVCYFVFPDITEKYPAAWGPKEGQGECKRIGSNVVTVNIEPYLPYSLGDAWLMADLVILGHIDETSGARAAVLPTYQEVDVESRKGDCVVVHEGNRFRVEEVLKGDCKEVVLDVDYFTRPRYERALDTGERVGALVARFVTAEGTRLRLFKAVPPQGLSAEAVVRLRGLRTGGWGAASRGLKCALLGPTEPVSAAVPVPFTVLLKFDAESADPKVVSLDRYNDEYDALAYHFRDAATGTTYVRRVSYPGGPGPDTHGRRATLRSDALRPIHTQVRLVTVQGESVPPGDYLVRATYEREGRQRDVQQYPWLAGAWSGSVTSPIVPLYVVFIEPLKQEMEFPTALTVERTQYGYTGKLSYDGARTMVIEQRAGSYLEATGRSRVYRGGMPLGGSESQGGVVVQGKRVWFPGGDDVLPQSPQCRESLHVAIDFKLYDTMSARSFWSPADGDPVLWEGTLEADLPPACEPDAPQGEWGPAAWGLQSRLALNRARCTPEEGVTIYLDVRSDSDDPIDVLTGKGLGRHLRIIGPKGRVRPADRDPEHDEEAWSHTLEPDEERTAVYVDTTENYRLTDPGRYRVEWRGAIIPSETPGLVPPSAADVWFEVVPAAQ